MTHTLNAVRASGVYLAAGVVWMLVSGRLGDSGAPRWIQSAADGFFLLATAWVVYWLARGREEKLSGQGPFCQTVSESGPSPVVVHDDLFRSLLEHAPDAVLLEAEGRIIYANTAMRALVGAPSRNLLSGLGVLELVHPGMRDALAKRLAELHQGKQSAGLTEETFKRLDGTSLACEMSAVPFQVEDKRGALMIIRDVTELNFAKDQIRRDQVMETVGQLAGGLAHDFNNLLQVINGTSELVYEALDAGNPMKNLLGNVRKAGESAAALVGQLLVISGRKELQMERFDLNDVVLKAVRMLEGRIGSHIQVNCALAQRTLEVWGDRRMLEQALISLSSSASDAMPRGSVFSVTTESVCLDDAYCLRNTWARAGTYAVIRVADTGYGAGREVEERMFEPFLTAKKEGLGAGLGLATVYRIVKQHDGLVHAASIPGKGSAFLIYLPVVTAPCEPVAQEKPGGVEIRGGRETILLAEDEEKVRLLMSLILRNAGYTVIEACNGAEAVELFQANCGQITGIVMDVVMPRMGGVEACRRIHALSPQMPVTFASAFSEDAVRVHRGLGSEVNLLQKPFSRSALLEAVRNMFDARAPV